MNKTKRKKISSASDRCHCWLEYRTIENLRIIESYKKWCSDIVALENTKLGNTVVDELCRGIKEMLGFKPSLSEQAMSDSFILLGILGKQKLIDQSINSDEKSKINEDGFIIKTLVKGNKSFIIVAAKSEKGLLYGVFNLLRHIQMQKKLEDLNIIENPSNPLRIINHWDNIDGSIERGYAGKSIFFHKNKIVKDLSRIKDYSRLLASIGINAVVINNVNVHKHETNLITKEYLPDVARLAAIFREYGIKIFLSINFASPMEIGNQICADPLNIEVINWWREKAEEIYDYIPDFGGFLVKADSEFRPGPFTYDRNHADGANMLAQALHPFGGVVIWRCFVYNCMQDWRNITIDRAKAAYDNFKPLDGKFWDNVILQIKNGPMDFQVREPVSPLFGGLNQTNQVLELQITQEYTGQQKHLCYLIPMWKEIMDFDTYAKGKGSTVKKIANGSLYNKYGGIAGVANIGNDFNWTGHKLAQANFYGFGRLSWNTDLSSAQITDEWVRMTFSNEKDVVDTIASMLLGSWNIYENYTSPLGIGWMVNPSHHYGPSVDGYEYSKWGTYHRADNTGIGVDRSVKGGTGFVGQYYKEVAKKYEKLEKCPEELLLFFHRVPYEYRLKSGETLIQYIYNTHFKGVEQVIEMRDKWVGLKDIIKDNEFCNVLERLEEQIKHSEEWRDVINSYFYRKSGIKDDLGRKIY